MAAKEALRQEGKEGRARTLADVRALARVLRQYDLSELEVERDGERIRLSRSSGGVPAMQMQPPPLLAEPLTGTSIADTPETDDGTSIISSPFVGTFYRAPSPESPPFVDVGQAVGKGTTLCIVEAMKLMNEIEAEEDCKIVDILVKNGEPVEFNQALFRVLPA